MKSSSHQWAAAFGISLLVLVSLVVIIVSRSSIGDIRNRASGVNCMEDRIQRSCDNPICDWDPNYGPYGGCVITGSTPALPESFRQECSTNPNATYKHDPQCSYNSATPCTAGSLSVMVTTCSGSEYRLSEGESCMDDSQKQQCESYRGSVNTKEACKKGVGCWVKSSSYCVVVGETNSGYVCQANGTFVKAGGTDESYRTPERTKPECEGQGNCWFGSYCLKSGRVGQESGEGSGHRSYCCNNGRLESSQKANGDSCTAPDSENTSNAITPVPSVSPSTAPTDICYYLRLIGRGDLCRQ